MAGILNGLAEAVETVAGASQGAPPAATTNIDPATMTGAVTVASTTENRLAALENFVITFGPVLEKLAPLLEKLEGL